MMLENLIYFLSSLVQFPLGGDETGLPSLLLKLRSFWLCSETRPLSLGPARQHPAPQHDPPSGSPHCNFFRASSFLVLLSLSAALACSPTYPSSPCVPLRAPRAPHVCL